MKNKKGFAVVNLIVKPENNIFARLNISNPKCNSPCYLHKRNIENLRTVIMGMKFKCNQIHEFDIDGNGIELAHLLSNVIFDFAHSVYQDNKLIISGGSYFSSNTGK